MKAFHLTTAAALGMLLASPCGAQSGSAMQRGLRSKIALKKSSERESKKLINRKASSSKSSEISGGPHSAGLMSGWSGGADNTPTGPFSERWGSPVSGNQQEETPIRGMTLFSIPETAEDSPGMSRMSIPDEDIIMRDVSTEEENSSIGKQRVLKFLQHHSLNPYSRPKVTRQKTAIEELKEQIARLPKEHEPWAANSSMGKQPSVWNIRQRVSSIPYGKSNAIRQKKPIDEMNELARGLPSELNELISLEAQQLDRLWPEFIED